MNTNDYDITIDYSNRTLMECEPKLIAITKNINCNDCEEGGDFDAMISDGSVWRCIECWEKTGNDPISQNMLDKLNETSLNVRKNYNIRNFM
jgi:hypothetical protein